MEAMVSMTSESCVNQFLTPQHHFKHEFSHLPWATKYQRYGRVQVCNKLCLTSDYVQSYYQEEVPVRPRINDYADDCMV